MVEKVLGGLGAWATQGLGLGLGFGGLVHPDQKAYTALCSLVTYGSLLW